MLEDNFELNDEIIDAARKSITRLVENLICISIDEIETYRFPMDELFGIEIIHDNALFYLIVKFSKENKNFICFAPGASDRDKKTSSGELKVPPFFTRWKWHKYFDESTIAFADPMLFLNDEIKLGWFIGVEDHWYLETLSEIMKKLAINQNVKNDNILFYGSSGGGYVSVCLATLIQNSKVLVNNAQFFVLNYYPRLVNMALKATFNSFEGLNQAEIIHKILYRLDATELFKKEGYAPHITYYVNVKSENDIINQTMPLVSSYYNQNEFNGLDVVYYSQDSKKPHNPLPNEVSINIIRDFAKKNLYNCKHDSNACEFKIKMPVIESDMGKKENEKKNTFKRLFGR